MAELPPRCPTCMRPVFVPGPTAGLKPDPLKHCPRALAEPASPESQQTYLVCCLVVGVTTRDELLDRAKELLGKVDGVLWDAAGELSELHQANAEEVSGG